MKTIDRLQHATALSRGRRVLDIGGQKMENCDPRSPFAREYRRISESAAEYRIVDYQRVAGVDYVIDLNRSDGLEQLRATLREYRPEVVLCMETLEHLNRHFECMNILAEAVEDLGCTVFITVPNNGNWVFNALGWNADHVVGFLRGIADRFVKRSDLGKHEVEAHACVQRYLWYWWVVHLASFCQPLNWGFTIRPRSGQPKEAVR